MTPAAAGTPRASDGLAEVLALEADGCDAFIAVVPGADMSRPFGGYLIGLAIAAAVRTVDAVTMVAPHAVHARFIRAGRTGKPAQLLVDRVHDGRWMAVRRLTVV